MNFGFVKVSALSPKIRVADPEYNAEAVVEAMQEAAAAGVRFAVFPELILSGYTCGDLFFQSTLLDGVRTALETVCRKTAKLDLIAVVGLPLQHRGKLYNCAAVLHWGRVLGIVPKTAIPNYAEFSEARWFTSAPQMADADADALTIFGEAVPFGASLLFRCTNFPAFTFGVEICEDLWIPDSPSVELCRRGATIIANLSASSETVGKRSYRRQLISSQSARCICGYVYADAGEGESSTDLVFSGHCMVAEDGRLLAQAAPFSGEAAISDIDCERLVSERMKTNTFSGIEEGTVVSFEVDLPPCSLTRTIEPTPFVPLEKEALTERCETILSLQAAGLKKRILHTNAKSLVVGVSGGLDSTLALLAMVRTVDLLGYPRSLILAVTMPCFGTTKRTKGNAQKLCEALGVTLRTIPITKAVQQHFKDIGQDPQRLDVTYENSQARERTQVLMDLANRSGGLVVGTGDLSELALGWATYNGDHMSMYGVNAGVPKTLLRHIVRYVAETCEDKKLRTVLEDILNTPVSPELLPAGQDGTIAQKTEDLVGPYELHDFFLYYGIRWSFSPAKVYYLARNAFCGSYPDETILKWLKTFYRRFFAQQFKRSCLPDGPKIGTVSFSPRGDWKMPSDASSVLWMSELEKLS